MNRNLILAVILSLAASCGQKDAAPDYTKMSDEERLNAAIEIAQSTIMVDGHVDLPYRMKVGGFTLQREILDVSVRTPDGNLTIQDRKKADSMRHLCPFTFLR